MPAIYSPCMETTRTAPTRTSPAETHRCAGCGEHTAPEADFLCTPCTDSQPEDDGYAGDVGFEGGDFY